MSGMQFDGYRSRFVIYLWLILLTLAGGWCECEAQEFQAGVIVNHSEAAGYDGPVYGVELIGDVGARLRIEGSAHRIDKFDGGDGYAYRGMVGVHLPHSFIVSVQASGMNTEKYERTDLWLVVDWAFLRAELEQESWRVTARPQFDLFEHLYVRPELGYTSGRGSDGVIAALAIGGRW